MAHELDTRDNGAAAFVSLRQSAWHQLGTIAADEMTFDEAMNLGGLDYPLALRPLTTSLPIEGANGDEIDTLPIEVPGHRAVVRADRNKVLGVVSDRYELVTNREAMQMVDVLVNDGLAVIETAGVLREGADAWMAIRFTGEQIEAAGENGGDEIKFYGLVRTNHNGKASVQVATTPVRVVCANTLAMALGNGQTTVRSVMHMGTQARTKVREAAQSLWSGTLQDAEKMAAAFAAMQRTPISEAQFETTVLDVLCPMPELPAADASKLAHSLYPSRVMKANETRFQIQELWISGTGQQGACTAWDAYNACTEALDHYDTVTVKGAPHGDVADRQARAAEGRCLRSTPRAERVSNHSPRAVHHTARGSSLLPRPNHATPCRRDDRASFRDSPCAESHLFSASHVPARHPRAVRADDCASNYGVPRERRAACRVLPAVGTRPRFMTVTRSTLAQFLRHGVRIVGRV
ncbi:DUF932 domain-containing protein [Gemmatimonas sp.]